MQNYSPDAISCPGIGLLQVFIKQMYDLPMPHCDIGVAYLEPVNFRWLGVGTYVDCT